MYLVMFLELNCCHVREISLKCLMLKGSVHVIVILCVCIYIFIYFLGKCKKSQNIYLLLSPCAILFIMNFLQTFQSMLVDCISDMKFQM